MSVDTVLDASSELNQDLSSARGDTDALFAGIVGVTVESLGEAPYEPSAAEIALGAGAISPNIRPADPGDEGTPSIPPKPKHPLPPFPKPENNWSQNKNTKISNQTEKLQRIMGGAAKILTDIRNEEAERLSPADNKSTSEA